MPEELYLLVIVKSVESVFNLEETKDTVNVVGVFLDKPIADFYAVMWADKSEPGDRVCVLGYDAKKDLGIADVLVVVGEGVS